jgi:hypothetical protein
VQSSTEEVEAELLELWSNVEKERAAKRERAAAHACAKAMAVAAPAAHAALGAAGKGAMRGPAARITSSSDGEDDGRLLLAPSAAAMADADAAAAVAAFSGVSQAEEHVVDVPAPMTPAAGQRRARQQRHAYAALRSPPAEDSPAEGSSADGQPMQLDVALPRLAPINTGHAEAAAPAAASSSSGGGEGVEAAAAAGQPRSAEEADRDEERRASEQGASPSGAAPPGQGLLDADGVDRRSTSIEPKLYRMLSSVPQVGQSFLLLDPLALCHACCSDWIAMSLMSTTVARQCTRAAYFAAAQAQGLQ